MKTLGEIAYDAFAAGVGLTCPWLRLSDQNKAAWESVAVKVVAAVRTDEH
jgi:hypothetical protein